MDGDYTTITVNPARAAGLKAVRDEQDLKSMDAALESLLEAADGKSKLIKEADVPDSKPTQK